jgi:hypothetical protein
METKNSIKLFESKQVRSVWDGEQEKWHIIIDIAKHTAVNLRMK